MEYEEPKDLMINRPVPVFNTTQFAKKIQPRRTTMIINPSKINPPKQG